MTSEQRLQFLCSNVWSQFKRAIAPCSPGQVRFLAGATGFAGGFAILCRGPVGALHGIALETSKSREDMSLGASFQNQGSRIGVVIVYRVSGVGGGVQPLCDRTTSTVCSTAFVGLRAPKASESGELLRVLARQRFCQRHAAARQMQVNESCRPKP